MALVQQGVERQSVGWRLNVCDTQTSRFIAVGIQTLEERPTLPGVLSDELRRSVSHACRALLLRDYSPAPASLWRDDPPSSRFRFAPRRRPGRPSRFGGGVSERPALSRQRNDG